MLRLGRVALFVFVALVASENTGWTYCRSTACQKPAKGQGKICEPPEPDDCSGAELQWKQPCVGFTVQQDGSSQVPFETIHAVTLQAFEAWTKADCGNGVPAIKIKDLGDVICDRVEYNQSGANTNVVMFRDGGWTHEDKNGSGPIDTNTIALTTVTYDAQKGDIFDADMEVNSAQFTFTTTDDAASVDTDLLSVLTHEAGHFLGIAHTTVNDATMFPNYPPQSITLRSLEDDDMAAICAAYPKGRATEGECSYLPRHGYASECLDEQYVSDCALSPGRASASASVFAATAALIAAALLRARLRRPAKPNAHRVSTAQCTRRKLIPRRHGGSRGGGARPRRGTKARSGYRGS